MAVDVIAFAKTIESASNALKAIVESDKKGAADIRFFLLLLILSAICFLVLTFGGDKLAVFLISGGNDTTQNTSGSGPHIGKSVFQVLFPHIPSALVDFINFLVSILLGFAIVRFWMMFFGKTPKPAEITIVEPIMNVKTQLASMSGLRVRLHGLYADAQAGVVEFAMKFVTAQESTNLKAMFEHSGQWFGDEYTFIRVYPPNELKLLTVIYANIAGPSGANVSLRVMLDLKGTFDSSVEADKQNTISGDWHHIGEADSMFKETGGASIMLA